MRAAKGEHRTRLAASIATVLLLVDPSLRSLLALLSSGTITLDVDLLTALYWNSPGELRVAWASAPAARFLRPVAFRRMWLNAVRRASSDSEKVQLALSLAAHLARNKLSIKDYEQEVLRIFVDTRRRGLRIRGYELLGFSRRASPAVVGRLGNGLLSRSAIIRVSALHGISVMAHRYARLPKREIANLLQIRHLVAERRRDADADVRMGADNALAALDAAALAVGAAAQPRRARGTRPGA